MVTSMLPSAAAERSSERGVALVLAMFMVLMVSVVGASLMSKIDRQAALLHGLTR